MITVRRSDCEIHRVIEGLIETCLSRLNSLQIILCQEMLYIKLSEAFLFVECLTQIIFLCSKKYRHNCTVKQPSFLYDCIIISKSTKDRQCNRQMKKDNNFILYLIKKLAIDEHKIHNNPAVNTCIPEG